MSDAVAPILDKWVKLRGSGTLSAAERQKLLAEVVTKGVKAPELYRGTSGSLPPGGYTVGRALDFGPASTSEDLDAALPYAENGDGTPVVFQFDGAKGLNVQDRAEGEGFAEKEWVTGGRFYVTEVDEEDGVTFVTVSPRIPPGDAAQKEARKTSLDMEAGFTPEAAAPAPDTTSEALVPAPAASTDEKPVKAPKTVYADHGDGDVLTQRSSDYFDSILHNIEMWDGAGLVDAYNGDSGNLTDLIVKGYIATYSDNGKHSFAYLTPKGWALADKRMPELGIEINDFARKLASVEPDGTFPKRKEKVPTPEEIAKRSRPPLTGANRSYFFATVDPGAKLTSLRDRAYTAGDGDLWAALWKAQERWEIAQKHTPTKKEADRWPKIIAALESQIKFRYLADPSADEDLRLPDGTPISPEDYRALTRMARELPTEQNIGKILKDLPYYSEITKRLEAARLERDGANAPDAPDAPAEADEEASSAVEEVTPEVEAPAAPEPSALERALAKLDADRERHGEIAKKEVFPTNIQGDPDTGSFVIHRTDGKPVEYSVNDNGNWVDESGNALVYTYPELWDAVMAGRPRSYLETRDGKSPVERVGGYGNAGFSEAEKYELARELRIPNPPNPRSVMGKHVTAKERNAYYSASSAWDTAARTALQRGGPEKFETGIGDPASATDDQLREALARMDAMSVKAYEPAHKISDSRRAWTALDHFEMAQSEVRTKSIVEAAAPLRAEMARRLLADTQVGQSDDFDEDRWAAASESEIYTDDNPDVSMTEEEWDKARNSYVANDVQTVVKNSQLRSGTPSSAATSWRNRMDRWTKSTVVTSDVVTYRGVAANGDLIRQLRPGATITDPGIVSTDASKGSAFGYLETRIKARAGSFPLLLEILTPEGHPMADAMYGEFVLPSRTPMVVKKVIVDDDGTYRVFVEVGDGSGQDVGAGGGPSGVTASGLHVRQALRERVRR